MFSITDEQLRPDVKSTPSWEGDFRVLRENGRSYSSFLKEPDQRELNFYADDGQEVERQGSTHFSMVELLANIGTE
jgi:hypothetical protein